MLSLDEMLWHMLAGHKANGIEFNVTYVNFSSNVWKGELFFMGWAQCLEIDKKWYLNIQPNEQKPKLLKSNNYESGCYLVWVH
jgi:hypothetical protein